MTKNERDQDEREERVARLLGRPVRDLEVPRFSQIEARLQRRTPGVIVVSAAVGLVVLGLVAGSALAARRASVPGLQPAAPAQPSETAGTSPTTNVLRPEYGVIYSGVRTGYGEGSAPVVRREGQTSVAAQLAPSYFNGFNGAVSPDGGRAAYFAQPQNGPWTLYLLDGARLSEQRGLVAIPEEIPGGRLVWSGDGNGIAFAVLNKEANQGVKPLYSAIRTLDLATGVVTERARVEDGSHYDLVGWERTGNTVAATRAPDREPATTYLTISPAGRRAWTLDGPYGEIQSAPNAREVVGVRCSSHPTEDCSLWIWPLDDFAARADQKLGLGLSLGLVGWRPGTTEVGLLVRESDRTKATSRAPLNGDRFELWSASRGHWTVALADGVVRKAFFRADGGALIIARGDQDAVVVDLGSGFAVPLPVPKPTAPFDNSEPVASIRMP